jgi:hypothetical protein
MLVAPILTAMLALPAYAGDRSESPEERAALLRPVAVAIAETAQSPETAAALIALGWHETKFARAVIEGRCSEMPAGSRCDNGRARGVWQAWNVACPAAYRFADGSLESLRAEVRCAVGNLYSARNRCERRAPELWGGAFSGYRGASCLWPAAARRVQTMREVLAVLRRWS